MKYIVKYPENESVGVFSVAKPIKGSNPHGPCTACHGILAFKKHPSVKIHFKVKTSFYVAKNGMSCDFRGLGAHVL